MVQGTQPVYNIYLNVILSLEISWSLIKQNKGYFNFQWESFKYLFNSQPLGLKVHGAYIHKTDNWLL
jgi:hypothetical protein